MAKKDKKAKASDKSAKPDKVAKKAEKVARKQAKAAAKAAKPAKAPKPHKPAKAAKPPKPAKKAKAAKVSPVPKGLHTVTPNLVFTDCVPVIAFYVEAFGAKEVSRMPGPDGKGTWHAEVRIGDGTIFMNDASPNSTAVAPSVTNRATASLQLFVKDCDAWVERAVKAGAKAVMPVADMFWGDRMGVVVDPFGVGWMISTRTANLSPKEMKKAGDDFIAQMAKAGGMPAAEVKAPEPGPEHGKGHPQDG